LVNGVVIPSIDASGNSKQQPRWLCLKTKGKSYMETNPVVDYYFPAQMNKT
jgi:hypothetical protein